MMMCLVGSLHQYEEMCVCFKGGLTVF